MARDGDFRLRFNCRHDCRRCRKHQGVDGVRTIALGISLLKQRAMHASDSFRYFSMCGIVSRQNIGQLALSAIAEIDLDELRT